MVEQGEGKAKATFCNLSRAQHSISRCGDLFFFCQCGKLNCSPDSNSTVCVHTTWQWPTFVSSLADGLQAVQVWILGRGMSPQRWGWLGPAWFVCVGCTKLSGHAGAADGQEECPTFREVVGVTVMSCLSPSTWARLGASSGYGLICVRLGIFWHICLGYM